MEKNISPEEAVRILEMERDHLRANSDSSPERIKAFEMAIQNLKPSQGVKSHSEKEILQECIHLMQELADYFQEYLEWISYEPESDEDAQAINISYFHIVQRLFLFHTRHSGGTSTIEKCRELGIKDWSESVAFNFGANQEEA